MEILFCEHCNARQPIDWKAGDLCTGCGKLPRSEVRCGWCAKMTPEGGFCRHCGFELTDPLFYGATRMLKAEGVDKFGLNERLNTLSDAHKNHFENMYNQQLAVMNQHIDDVIFCEEFLLGNYHNQFAQAFLEMLPLAPEELEGYRQERPFFDSDQERLKYLSFESPIFNIQEMASIALLVKEDDPYESTNRLIDRTLDNPLLNIETLWLVGHWRGALDKCSEEQIDAYQSLAKQHLEGPCGFWATATLVKVHCWLGHSVEPKHLQRLENGLKSNDPDLSFAAAVILEDEQALFHYKGPGTVYATYILCMMGSPLLADVIKGSTEEQLLEIVSYIKDDKPPVSTPAKYALLRAMPEDPEDSDLFDNILNILLDYDYIESEVLQELIRDAQRRESSRILFELLHKAEDDLDEENIKTIMGSLAGVPIHSDQMYLIESTARKKIFKPDLIEHLSNVFAAWVLENQIEKNKQYDIFNIYGAQLKFKKEAAAPWVIGLLSHWKTTGTENTATKAWHLEVIENCWEYISDFIISLADGSGEMVRPWIAAINRLLVEHFQRDGQFGRSLHDVPHFYKQMAQKPAFGFEIYQTLWGFVFQEDNLPLSEAIAKWMVDYFDLAGDAPFYRIPNQDQDYKFGPVNEHWDTHFFKTEDDCLEQLNAIITTPRFGRLSDWLVEVWDKNDPTWLIKFAHSQQQLTPLLRSLSEFKGGTYGYGRNNAANIVKQSCIELLNTDQAGFYADFLLEVYSKADDNQYTHLYGRDESIAQKLTQYLETLPDDIAAPFYSRIINILDQRIRRNEWNFSHMKYCSHLADMLETAAEKDLIDEKGMQKMNIATQYIRDHDDDEFDQLLRDLERITAPD